MRERSTEWFEIVAWNRLAELSEDWLEKSSIVLVEGRRQTRTYEDANKVTHKTEVIVARRLMFLSSKKTGTAPEVHGLITMTANDKDDSRAGESDDAAFPDLPVPA